MKVQDLFPKKPRQQKQEAAAGGFTDQQIQANMELLRQELEPMRKAANWFFTGFTVPPTKTRPAQFRCWLLPGGEQFDDLNPTQTDYVLKNLEWFKAQISVLHERLNDDLIY